MRAKFVLLVLVIWGLAFAALWFHKRLKWSLAKIILSALGTSILASGVTAFCMWLIITFGD